MNTVFIGPSGNKGIPTNGASIKNYQLLKKIKEYGVTWKIFDSENWKRRPRFLISLLCQIIKGKGNTRYILSLNSSSANRIIRIIRKFDPTAKIVYLVIGGAFAKRLKAGAWKIEDYLQLEKIIVEGDSMQKDLEYLGLSNVETLPNFKIIPKLNITQKVTRDSEHLKFIFLSRITPEKGCNLIFAALEALPASLCDNLQVDFYGPIDERYKKDFESKIALHPNTRYKGFMDLRNLGNYAVLSEYDAMLFPTYWAGEGCPGVVIDALIAQVPILASDWNLNRDYVIENVTGIIFPSKNPERLLQVIREVLENPGKLNDIRANLPTYTYNFSIENILSIKNLKRLGIIDE